MDYLEHYNRLIDRAKSRSLFGYKETHHIVPRCLGGSDDKSNLVDLTPEEHYVAHQLLIKIYKKEPRLLFAARMMTVSNASQKNRNNKLYGWIRRLSNQNQKDLIKSGKIKKPPVCKIGTIRKDSLKVYCIQEKRIFNSMSDAARFAKIKDPNCIKKAATGVTISAGGYNWCLVDEGGKPIFIKRKSTINLRKSRTVMCNETGEIFNSIKEACLKYGGDIYGCLYKKQLKAKGFTWRFINE